MKKKLIIILTVALIGAILPAAAKKKANEGQAMPRVAEAVYDFGIINEKGGPVTHEFEISNVGDGNLVIIDATAECGCTRPDYPKNPIAPGKKSKIKVTYNPIGRPGAFEKTVTVKTNGKPKKLSIKIRGNVVPQQ